MLEIGPRSWMIRVTFRFEFTFMKTDILTCFGRRSAKQRDARDEWDVGLTISLSFSLSPVAAHPLAPLAALTPFVLSNSEQRRIELGPFRARELRVRVACGAGFFMQISSVAEEDELIRPASDTSWIYNLFADTHEPIVARTTRSAPRGQPSRERQPWRTICRPNTMWSS